MRRYYLNHETGRVSISDTGPPPGDLVDEIDALTFYQLALEELEQALNGSGSRRSETL